jgi:hypothetical protein
MVYNFVAQMYVNYTYKKILRMNFFLRNVLAGNNDDGRNEIGE